MINRLTSLFVDQGYVALKELGNFAENKNKEKLSVISSQAQAYLQQYNKTTALAWASRIASTTLQNTFKYIGIPFGAIFVGDIVSSSINNRPPVTTGIIISALATSFFAVPYIHRNATYQANQEYKAGIALYSEAVVKQQAHVLDLSRKIEDYAQAAFDSENVGKGVYGMLEDAHQNLGSYKKHLKNMGFRGSDVDTIVKPLATTLQTWLKP